MRQRISSQVVFYGLRSHESVLAAMESSPPDEVLHRVRDVLGEHYTLRTTREVSRAAHATRGLGRTTRGDERIVSPLAHNTAVREMSYAHLRHPGS